MADNLHRLPTSHSLILQRPSHLVFPPSINFVNLLVQLTPLTKISSPQKLERLQLRLPHTLNLCQSSSQRLICNWLLVSTFLFCMGHHTLVITPEPRGQGTPLFTMLSPKCTPSASLVGIPTNLLWTILQGIA